MTTNKLIRAMVGTFLLAGASAPAFAATTIAGSVTSLNFQSSDPGLVVFANPLSFAPVTLNTVGSFADRNILTIGTNEGSVSIGEDTNLSPISVGFTFSSPTGASGLPVTGQTFGFIIPFTSCGIIAGGCGRVDFAGPSTFNFGNGGKFSVELFDANFGTPGSATVTGRFTLLAAAVPEPATWAMMIGGFGMVGGAMRSRRRKQKVSVSFA